MPCHTPVQMAHSMEEESRREPNTKALAAAATASPILQAHSNFLVVFEGLRRLFSVTIVHRTTLSSFCVEPYFLMWIVLLVLPWWDDEGMDCINWTTRSFVRIFYIDYYSLASSLLELDLSVCLAGFNSTHEPAAKPRSEIQHSGHCNFKNPGTLVIKLNTYGSLHPRILNDVSRDWAVVRDSNGPNKTKSFELPTKNYI